MLEDEASPTPNPYCTAPGYETQLKAWDSTAMRRFMECPRKYQLAQVQGWKKGGNEHITFGRLYHLAAERYDHGVLDGLDRGDATLMAMRVALDESWGFGSYEPVWQCTDPAQVLGPRSGKLTRNAKQCLMAKEPQWGGHRACEPCIECGLPTVDDWLYVSESPVKNRHTLMRAVLHYCDTADERVMPYVFPDGTRGIELSFRIPLPMASPDGDPYLLCGHIDSLVSVASEVLPRERKTTKSTLGKYFFDRFSPDLQIDNYDLACSVLYAPNLSPKPSGVMVEALQVGVGADTVNIDRQIINIPEERREENLQDVMYWIKQAERAAHDGYYPKNTASCNNAGGCAFREICRMSPSVRERFLPGERFTKSPWNPMSIR